jgi:hypothetical protein
MRAVFIAVLIAAQLAAVSLDCRASAVHIGIMKSLSGEVMIARGSSIIKAEPNLKLLKGDVVQTGAKSKAGMILEDDTVISIGPDSRIALEDFVFQPNEKKLSFIARVLQGTASYISGQIAKLAPDRVHLETPQATIGIRGTHVLLQVD